MCCLWRSWVTDSCRTVDFFACCKTNLQWFTVGCKSLQANSLSAVLDLQNTNVFCRSSWWFLMWSRNTQEGRYMHEHTNIFLLNLNFSILLLNVSLSLFIRIIVILVKYYWVKLLKTTIININTACKHTS